MPTSPSSLDQLTLVMLLVVTGVGFLIHIYSVGYMAHEEGYWRFFAYLNLFMFFMLTLVLADNFLLMFVGWEGVGLASYLLIGFYFQKDSAADAGKKAFVVNRIGDFGFLLGDVPADRPLRHAQLQRGRPARSRSIPTGMAASSPRSRCCWSSAPPASRAQIPLYVWLPDAMEGPTPVSALIHAATMVTAGVYMVARTHVLFDRSPLALSVVAIIGAATAFFAATIGIVQTDIKRVLAYSTISQLGYMFLACGAAAYSAAIFHLVTHAFFKALLFLAAGSVIHAVGGEQDMRNMGGLRKLYPDHLLDHDHGRLRHLRLPALLRLLLQGRTSSPRPSAPQRRSPAVGCRSGHRGPHLVLHVPPLVHDLLWPSSAAAGGRSSRGVAGCAGRCAARRRALHQRPSYAAAIACAWHPREPLVHAASSRAARDPLCRRRLDRHSPRPRRRRPLRTLPRAGDAWHRRTRIVRTGLDRYADRRARYPQPSRHPSQKIRRPSAC